MKFLAKLPYLTDLQRTRRPAQKGKTRLEARIERDALRIVDDRQFRKDVWARDGGTCRCCGRRVVATIARVHNRREVHHLHGRLGALRHEVRAAVGVCLECHEQLTGKVNAKITVRATKTFTLDGERYTDATAPLLFERVV